MSPPQPDFPAVGKFTHMDITIDIEQLKKAVESLEADPKLFCDERVRYFRDYLQSVSAKLPLCAFYHIKYECKVVIPDYEISEAMAITEFARGDRQPCTIFTLVKEKMAKYALDYGRREEAISHLNEGILADPSNVNLLGMRGKTFIKMRKPKAAVRDAEAMLDIEKTLASAHLIKGFASSMLGKWEIALESLSFCGGLEGVTDMIEKVQRDQEKLNKHLKLVQHNETLEGVDWKQFAWLCQNTPRAVFDNSSFSFIVNYLRSVGVNVQKIMKPKTSYCSSSDDDDDELKIVRVPTEAELSKVEEPVELASSSRGSVEESIMAELSKVEEQVEMASSTQGSVEESIKAELSKVEEQVEMASSSQGSVEESIKAEVSAVEEPVEMASSSGGTVKNLVKIHADKIEAQKK